MKEKNYSIEFYRIIATLIICIHHMQGKCGFHFIQNGDLCVDIFFILSGMFLARTFISESSHSGSRYLFRRLERLYPEYVFAAFVGVAGYAFVGKFSISKFLPELFLVQNLGPFSGGFNYPCWYLSVLIFASFVLYELLKYKTDFFVKIAAPLVVVCGYTYIKANLESDFIWSTQGFVHIPLLRCFCGMTLGIFICYISNCSFIKSISPVAGTIFEISCIVVAGFGIFTNMITPSLTISASALLIFITYNKLGFLSKSLFNHKFIGKISGYSYPVYLNHGIMANTLDIVNHRIGIDGKYLLIIYLVLVIVYSAFTHHLISFIVKKIKRKCFRKNVKT